MEPAKMVRGDIHADRRVHTRGRRCRTGKVKPLGCNLLSCQFSVCPRHALWTRTVVFLGGNSCAMGTALSEQHR